MDAQLARFKAALESQHGLITIEQLRAGHLTDDQRQGLVSRRVLQRVRPRVFAVVGSPDSWERGLLAAVLSIDGSVASHAAAARLWAFEPRPEDRYEITLGRRYRAKLRGVVFHWSTTLEEVDVAQRSGIACTSFERTLADCTTHLSQYQLGRALDNGLRRGVASLRLLRKCAERLESGPGRHMSLIRSLLTERGMRFDPGGSRSEIQLLDVFRRGHLPAPVQQYRVEVGTKSYRPDFAWPDSRVFAEYYGLPFHTGASAVVSDSRRLTALASAGWLPLVFTHASTDREIIERTAEALHRRRVVRETSP